MAFSQGELDNIANATLDHYIRGAAFSQIIQERPLYDAMRKAQKTTPGGKGDISIPVKGVYTSAVAGYTHNDTVTYANPANIKRVNYPWREHHSGIGVTLTELKHSGISVVDSTQSKSTTQHSDSDLVVLTNLLSDKLEDLAEGWARSFTTLLYGDGTGDAKALAGLAALLPANPLAGTIGGINRATTAWWRHRALTAAHATASTVAADGAINTSTAAIDNVIHTEMRQLKRYGGRPNIAVAGSAFLDALAARLRDKGNYTDSGWSGGAKDIAMADIKYRNVPFVYDPALDDLSLSKRCYILDTSKICLYVMDGEDMKRHTPARPHDQYVMYRGVTWTGQMALQQSNAQGVYDIV